MAKEKSPESVPALRFDPDRQGLEALMGPLEARVMQALWDLGQATVRETWERLGGEGEVAYTTVLTIFHRLHEKGLVEREPDGRAHRYRPLSSRSEFQGNALSRLLTGILDQVRRNRPLGVIGRLDKRDRALLRRMLEEAEREP